MKFIKITEVLENGYFRETYMNPALITRVYQNGFASWQDLGAMSAMECIGPVAYLNVRETVDQILDKMLKNG